MEKEIATITCVTMDTSGDSPNCNPDRDTHCEPCWPWCIPCNPCNPGN